MTTRQKMAAAVVVDYACWFSLGFVVGYFVL